MYFILLIDADDDDDVVLTDDDGSIKVPLPQQKMGKKIKQNALSFRDIVVYMLRILIFIRKT